MANALLRAIVASLRNAEVTKGYTVPDPNNSENDDATSRVSVAEYDAAEELVAFDEDPSGLTDSFDEVELNDEDRDLVYVSSDFDIDAVREALRTARKVFRLKTEIGSLVDLSEKAYNALKPTKTIEFEYLIPGSDNYKVVIDVGAKTLSIGCQTHSISQWKRGGKGIIEDNLYAGTSAAEAAYEALQLALPAIEERLERENPSPRRSRAKTAAGRTRSRRKTATGRRSRRRSTGRSRSR